MSSSRIHFFPDISPKAYEHPADRAATAALASIPYVDVVVNKLLDWQFEREFQQDILGGSVLLSEKQMPKIWNIWQEVLLALDLPRDIPLYLLGSSQVNAMAVGSNKPMVVINSALVNLLNEKELKGVLAHEAAHILSGHVRYKTALVMLLEFGAKNIPFFARLPLKAVIMALMEWSRSSEFSCDRAAALVTGDPMVVCSTMMTLAGGIKSEQLDVNAFVAQADTYEGWENRWDRLKRFRKGLYNTHGLPVQRVTELTKWVKSGDWNNIIDGNYQKKSDPISVSKEAEQATSHYAEKFRSAFSSATEEAMNAAQTVADKLKGFGL